MPPAKSSADTTSRKRTVSLSSAEESKPAPSKRSRGRRTTTTKVKTTEDVTIPPEPPRRSGRARAAPRDSYTETVEQKPKAQRKAPAPKKGGRKKKMTLEELFQPLNLVSRHSPWATTIDASQVFSKDFIENVLTPEQRAKVISWLPECDLVYPASTDVGAPDPAPQIDHSLWSNPVFKDALSNWRNDLAEGKYEPEYIERGREARQKRMRGDFDAWKDHQFELFWGQKQTFYHDVVAGESSKVKAQDLVKYKQLRIGDIFAVRRSFAGGVTVRKEARLIAISPTDYSMSFSYPPGTNEWEKSGVENKTVEGVVSFTALETLLCREDGRVPGRLPNGNAFKTTRVIRKGEDIGCIFDVRAKFYHQYLENKEDYEEEW